MPSQKPAAVLFDLDGTLIDTAPDFHFVINQQLRMHQRDEVSYEYLRRYASNGARAMISAAFGPQEDQPGFDQLHQEMLNLYLQHICVRSAPFPGITGLLSWFGEQQIPWGIVTNKPERFTTPLMQALNLTPASSSTICPDQVQEKKPHPESLLLACREIGVDPADCIYVGDHQRDIEAGRRAGMTTIAASYGYIDDDENLADWQSDHRVDHAGEIQPLLEQLYRFPAS